MLSLLKRPEPETPQRQKIDSAKELFTSGQFQVVTTRDMPGKAVRRVVGLAAFRGYDMEQAFYGMITRALTNGANAIIGYQENVAFHPDGSKYISCYGTAVRVVDAQ
ncbi:heavy metal-binding domain-containing protein [Desulfocurvus sp.]|jgi:hypothetical protein|uniref:heavy metal-binding domain-containing protein n=1 Tax=Desulfocurvus sp. TaxID=2871698 RepID=UPI0025BADDA7|nr:heavy metal-binding domain-containing protein [Desulfocurvus sp.]MCK9240652.1 hypothetical protein [Desulfocurvus sp.]